MARRQWQRRGRITGTKERCSLGGRQSPPARPLHDRPGCQRALHSSATDRSWPLSPLCTRRFASASSARTFRDPESVVRAPAHVQQAALTVPEIAGMRECVAKATRIGDCCTRGLGVVSLHWPILSAPQRARIMRAHLYQCIRGWSRCSHGIANRRPRRQYQCHQRPPRRRRQGSPRARLLNQSSVLT